MIGALIILAITILTGVGLYIHHRITAKPDDPEPQELRPEGCCGQHEVCEKESLLTGVSKDVVYYEDEELDAYRGIAADDYTDEQIEQFREVLYTLKDDDIAGWARSISLRGITLPAPIREEVIMIVADIREKAAKEA